MKHLLFIILILFVSSCEEDKVLREEILSEYIELNSQLELSELVACAGGKEGGFLGTPSLPTDVFFYPINGATDFKYYESIDVVNDTDFSKYELKELTDEPVFNGYLWKFNNSQFTGERMCVVTYKSEGRLHVSDPIRQKTNVKPTEVNHDLLEVSENGVTPSFSWEDGIIKENVIYFQVISDSENNLISGTYTTEKQFTFYNLENVVFNITDTTSTPTLEPNQEYKFSLMGVSEDNWINVFFEQEFSTN